jgi:hypothetical protein
MKNLRAGNSKISEEAFSAGLIVVLLLILPQFGAVAMVVGSAIGMAAYLHLFPERFRTRSGSLAVGAILVAILAAIAVAAVVISLAVK